MSLKPRETGCVPEQTAAIARAAFPKGNVYMRFVDSLGRLFVDQDFAALFAHCGQPALPPARLALVIIFQFAENLSDRQAADAVRSRIDWKYALALELTDPGFDASVLVEFRARLLEGEAGARLLDAMLEAARAAGVFETARRSRTDSTHVLGALESLNRLELVGESVRHALEVLAVVAPEWLRATMPAEWVERYARRIEQYRLPKAAIERERQAERFGADGAALLEAIASAPEWLRQIPAVEVLRQIWVQQFYILKGRVRWRRVGDLPPAARRIASPYETEARYSKKRETEWIGYKVHVTETCDDEQPHLITSVETSAASVGDAAVLSKIIEQEQASGGDPAELLVDAGYLSGAAMVRGREAGLEVVGPVASNTSWQARAGQGYSAEAFEIDWEGEQARCPEGERSRSWREGTDERGEAMVHVRFAPSSCRACQRQRDCTTGQRGGRVLRLPARPVYEAIAQRRQEQTTPEFRERYAARAGIEGTISQAVRVCGLRRARYRGLQKTHLQHLATASALNFVRLSAWLGGIPHAKTQQTHLAKLAAAA
jgi:transposase